MIQKRRWTEEISLAPKKKVSDLKDLPVVHLWKHEYTKGQTGAQQADCNTSTPMRKFLETLHKPLQEIQSNYIS